LPGASPAPARWISSDARARHSFVYLFLYTPIALVVLFSFNAGRNASEFTGFSTQWYGKALATPS
jgi:spermidine/putrescine transport system permease protein